MTTNTIARAGISQTPNYEYKGVSIIHLKNNWHFISDNKMKFSASLEMAKAEIDWDLKF